MYFDTEGTCCFFRIHVDHKAGQANSLVFQTFTAQLWVLLILLLSIINIILSYITSNQIPAINYDDPFTFDLYLFVRSHN